MPAFDLACLGILVLDVFGKPIDVFPEKGTSAYFDTLEIHPGGCAYNTGVDAARLGMNVAVLGKLGADNFGDIMAEALQRERVDTRAIVRSAEAQTAFSFIMVPEDGQRRLYHTMGVNRTYAPADVPREVIARARVFHVAGAGLLPMLDGPATVDLLRFARGQGVITSLDPVVRPGIAELILPCLPYLDVFLPNSDESALITGLTEPADQLQFYRDRGARIVGHQAGAARVPGQRRAKHLSPGSLRRSGQGHLRGRRRICGRLSLRRGAGVGVGPLRPFRDRNCRVLRAGDRDDDGDSAGGAGGGVHGASRRKAAAMKIYLDLQTRTTSGKGYSSLTR